MRCSGRKLLIWSSLTFLLIFVGRLLFNRIFYLPILIIGNDDIPISKSRLNSERDTESGASAYVPGAYMAGQRPRNDSSCRWYHGLPRVLSYPATTVIWSLEIGEKSPYRILPYVLRGTEERMKLPEVTLCTHATADQVYGIVELAKRWEGPLSLAIFTPGFDADIAITLLDRACRCEPEMYKVSVHLVFPVDSPPLLGQNIPSEGDCAAYDLQKGEIKTERNQKRMTYPINVARNAARMQANTTRVLVSDIELLPSDKLASGFMKTVRGRAPKTGIVFVIPVFEIESNQKPPLTKKELLLAIEAGIAVYFHRFLCSHCQKFPGLTRWLLKPDPGRVRPLIVAKREYPHNRWEPVFIGTRNDPLYVEGMSWEGRQDKMTQMFEMCLLNYRLVILDGAFLVHTPGIKRKTKRISMAKREFLKAQEKKNAAIYQHVIKQLLKRYPINHKCA